MLRLLRNEAETIDYIFDLSISEGDLLSYFNSKQLKNVTKEKQRRG